MVGDQSSLQLLGFPIGGHRFVVASLGFEEIPQLLEARAESLAEERAIRMGRPERTQNVDGRPEMFFRLRAVVRVGFDDGQRRVPRRPIPPGASGSFGASCKSLVRIW